jgi:hypothetical protein
MKLAFCYFPILFLLVITACSEPEAADSEQGFIPIEQLPKALLASRFENLEALEKTVELHYYREGEQVQKADELNDKVVCSYEEGGIKIRSILEKGVSQAEIVEAKDGDWDALLKILQNAPESIALRRKLAYTNILARRRQDLTAWGDPAFYDLSELTVEKIIDKEAFVTPKDSGAKGYLNTFNHITAQALLTSIFSEQVADFIADVHERENMPELITGVFTADQLNNPNMNPMDNYVDMINNELGQELGKALKNKYNIDQKTKWTPKLLAAYLNELQAYYVKSFHIGMEAFDESEVEIQRFTTKVNRLFNKEFDYVIPTY